MYSSRPVVKPISEEDCNESERARNKDNGGFTVYFKKLTPGPVTHHAFMVIFRDITFPLVRRMFPVGILSPDEICH